jgi:FkbM family methyltransferase
MWSSPGPRNVIRKEAALYRYLLQPLKSKKGPIFDIGANTGWLTKVFLDYAEQVVSVEPEPSNIAVLHSRLRWRKNKVILVEAACGAESGTLELLVYSRSGALNTFLPKWKAALEDGFLGELPPFSGQRLPVSVVTLDTLIRQHGLPMFLKVDVEGYEREVFRGLNQSVPLMVFEANLPVFLQETLSVIDRLVALNPSAKFNYAEDFEIRLTTYVTADRFKEIIKGLGKASVDIICRGSGYSEYFRN